MKNKKNSNSDVDSCLNSISKINKEAERVIKKLPLYARMGIADLTDIVSKKLKTDYNSTYNIIRGYIGLRMASGYISVNKGGPGIKRV